MQCMYFVTQQSLMCTLYLSLAPQKLLKEPKPDVVVADGSDEVISASPEEVEDG